LKTLGNRFLVGGDFNAKNTSWGTRITTTKGRELQKTIRSNNLIGITTRHPTHWPSDPKKIPDLLDLCIAKGINPKNIHVESCLELTSDHTPIIVTILTSVRRKKKNIIY
jgi:endonuclease/exonuclease/phosphatase family metal-dependent hydrolase